MLLRGWVICILKAGLFVNWSLNARGKGASSLQTGHGFEINIADKRFFPQETPARFGVEDYYSDIYIHPYIPLFPQLRKADILLNCRGRFSLSNSLSSAFSLQGFMLIIWITCSSTSSD